MRERLEESGRLLRPRDHPLQVCGNFAELALLDRHFMSTTSGTERDATFNIIRSFRWYGILL